MSGASRSERIARQFPGATGSRRWAPAEASRALREIIEQSGWSTCGITADGLARLRSQFIKAGHVDALDLPGLTRDRRPVIAGGFAIMAGLFAELEIEHMDVAETAMREGILYDLLGRFHQHDMREATVDEFMRRYHIDTRQAERVKQVALKLLAASGGSDENDLRFLGWAARLHEIGLMVSHGGYHRHSGYILENADMPGFSRTDQARLALLGRAQRGALAKLPEFAAAAVPDNDRLLVWLLRQAVILCRSRAEPNLSEVTVEAGNKRIRLGCPQAGWSAGRLPGAHWRRRRYIGVLWGRNTRSAKNPFSRQRAFGGTAMIRGKRRICRFSVRSGFQAQAPLPCILRGARNPGQISHG